MAWVCQRLVRVSSLRFEACSDCKVGWRRVGHGLVETRRESERVITFTETGSWRCEQSDQGCHFTNQWRWTLDEVSCRITIHHLRFDYQHPVCLVAMVPKEPHRWYSPTPYQCGSDCYKADMTFTSSSILVRWTVQGTQKNETLYFCYW